MPWLALLGNRFVQMALIVAAAGLFIALQQYRINSCKADVAGLRAQAMILGNQIREQNDALDSLEKAAKEASERGQAALAVARRQSEGHKSEIKRLEAAKEGAQKGCKGAWENIRSGS